MASILRPAFKPLRSNALERSMYGLYDSAEAVGQKAHDACVLAAPVAKEIPTFNARLFASGEVSGAYFLAGASSKVKPPVRSGPVVTSSFSQKSKTKIRRAVENSSHDLVTFLTLTFSPWDLKPWEIQRYQCRLDGLSSVGSVHAIRSLSNGSRCRVFSLIPRVFHRRRKLNTICPVVRQDYAKHRLKNLRSALTMKVNRQILCKLKELPESEHEAYTQAHKFRLVWTAELQANGNIHFHALTNKYWAKACLAKLWPYGMTNIKKLSDSVHAAHYMVKYISKDENTSIEGNRYNISANLREDAMPKIYGLENSDAIEARKALQLMKQLIEDRGGKVIASGFGCNLPKPRRSIEYLDKKTGTKKRTKAIGRLAGDRLTIHEMFMDTFYPVREAYRSNGPVPF